MSKKNNYYYKNKKNNYKKNNYEKKNKITYDDLLHADTITEVNKEDNYNKAVIIKCIAVTIILFAIIFGSLILFRQI